MKTPVLLAAAALFLIAAGPVRYVQAPDATPPELAGADAQIVVNNCSACHSLDYITTQPRGKGAKFWEDAVAKMIKAYGAPLSPADAAAVSAILARKFG